MKSINDLNRLDKKVMEEIQKAAADCIASGWYVLGPNVAAFEKEFAQYCGASHCVSLANGTQALEIALKACGVLPGDEVITVANAGYYSTAAILACSAKPVYADVEPDNMLVDTASVAALIRPAVKAVVVTHLYGRLADAEKLAGLCGDKKIKLIEDCAQAHGAKRNGKKAGTFGDMGCFSFYPTKNLGAMGDAGAVTTNDKALAEKAAQLRQYGWAGKYEVAAQGGVNSRLDEIQAVVLRVKLKYLDKWNERRREVAAAYTSGIKNSAVKSLPAASGGDYAAHLYVIRTTNRDSLAGHLKTAGIPSAIHYPVPDYAQAALKEDYPGLRLENTEAASGEILTLPCFPEMTKEEISAVITAVNEWRGK